MSIDDIVNILEGQGQRKTNPIIYKSALFYFGSILLNVFNIRKNKEGNSRFIKYYGIVLANSGSGKSFAIDKVQSLFPKLKDYKNISRSVYLNNFNGDANSDIYKFMPTSTNSLEGTKEGLFKLANASANSGFGSLNLISEEIGDIANSSSDLLNKLKELYDGKYKAKIIKGSKDDEREEDIESIIVNALMMGSEDGIATETRQKVMSLVNSGLYRRSFIFDIEPEDVVQNNKESDISILKDYFSELFETNKSDFVPTKEKYMNDEKSEDLKKDINTFLIEQYNQNKYNKQFSADIGSFTAIENLAFIIAFLEFRSDVEKIDYERAFEFYKESRYSTKNTFNPPRPHNIMYTLLKRGKPLSISEMIEIDNLIPQSKNQIADHISLLDEKCYRLNEQLIVSGGKVNRYSIEPLPITDNNKIKLSVCVDNKYEKSVLFKQVEVPFFGDNTSVEKLITSDIQSFTTAWYKEKGNSDYGHRGKDYFISGQNIIAFDIDEGISLNECIELLSKYTYIIYTTKSHQKEKNGIICDRFRVLMPTKTEFFVDAEQHKKMYENLSVFTGITTYDVATRNVSRLWFTNKDALIFKNKAENIDVAMCIPDTDKEEFIMPSIEEIEQQRTNGVIDNRIAGFYKWFLSNTTNGNRNSNLYSLTKFMEEIGEDKEYHARYCNSMLNEPLSDKEVNAILRR